MAIESLSKKVIQNWAEKNGLRQSSDKFPEILLNNTPYQFYNFLCRYSKTDQDIVIKIFFVKLSTPKPWWAGGINLFGKGVFYRDLIFIQLTNSKDICNSIFTVKTTPGIQPVYRIKNLQLISSFRFNQSFIEEVKVYSDQVNNSCELNFRTISDYISKFQFPVEILIDGQNIFIAYAFMVLDETNLDVLDGLVNLLFQDLIPRHNLLGRGDS